MSISSNNIDNIELVKSKVPRVLTPEKKALFLDAISKGASMRLACGACGWGYATLGRWFREAKVLIELANEEYETAVEEAFDNATATDDMFSTAHSLSTAITPIEETDVRILLYRDMCAAEWEFAQKNLITIQDASKDPRNWTAAAWLLERTNPSEYGTRKRIEVDIDWKVEIVERGIKPSELLEAVVQSLMKEGEDIVDVEGVVVSDE